VSAESSGRCSAACQAFVDKYGDECEDTVRTLAAACFDDSDSDEDSASDEDSDVGEVDDIETEVDDDDTAVDDADVEDEDYGDDNSIPADINIPGLPRECVEYFSKNEQLSQECEAAKEVRHLLHVLRKNTIARNPFYRPSSLQFIGVVCVHFSCWQAPKPTPATVV
jgi:hypothetical protein